MTEGVSLPSCLCAHVSARLFVLRYGVATTVARQHGPKTQRNLKSVALYGKNWGSLSFQPLHHVVFRGCLIHQFKHPFGSAFMQRTGQSGDSSNECQRQRGPT